MFDENADRKARNLFEKLKKKAKTSEEIGKAIDKAIDFYFANKKDFLEFDFEK